MGLLENILTASIRGEKIPKISDWVEWKHIFKGETHCETCLKLDRCWFAKDEMPKLPQHMFCHCEAKSLSIDEVINKAKSICLYSKFNPYLFDPEDVYKHKKERMYKGMVSFITGWMVHPSGEIRLVTPYGGK